MIHTMFGVAFTLFASVATAVDLQGHRGARGLAPEYTLPAFAPALALGEMRLAKALGLKVVVWTVNDAEAAGRMLDLGVDGIISDRPDLMKKLVEERKRRKLP